MAIPLRIAGSRIRCSATARARPRIPATQPGIGRCREPVASWVVLKFGGTSVSRRNRWDTIGRLAAQTRGRGRRARAGGGVGAVRRHQRAAGDRRSAPSDDRRVAHRRAGRAPPRVLRRTRPRCRRGARRAPRRAARAGQRSARADRATLRLAGRSAGAGRAAVVDARRGLPARAGPRLRLDATRATGSTRVSLPNQSAWAQRLSVNCRCARRRRLAARASRSSPRRMLVTQGFIARHGDGGTAILGRGGSDTSAAYFGALLGAQRVEIWTDVPGMFSANPREVPDARLLDAPGLRRSAGNRHHRRQGAASALDRAVPRRRRADGDPRYRAPRPARHAHRRAAPRPCPASRRSAAATASCWCRWKASACGSRSASSPTCSSASSATACRST